MVLSKSLILAMGMISQVFAGPIDLENGLLARDGPKPILVPWEQYDYLRINITVGSQKTPLLVAWDTGASENGFWLANSNVTCIQCIGKNKDCRNDTNICKETGTFDPLNSTTFVDLHKNWSIIYQVGEADLGWLGTDQVGIGNSNGEAVTIQDIEFAVADFAYDQPILGIGVDSSNGPNYLPNKLKDQGHITKAAFSYWHDSLLGGTGSFLLGGLDKAKYKGDLIALPVIDFTSAIFLSAIVVDGEHFPQGVAVVVDTGSPSVYFTPPVLANITTKLGGSLDSWDGNYFSIPCDQGNKTIDFVFGNASIVIPLSEFIGPAGEESAGLCELCIGREDGFLIGIPIQKYAYWVYDNDDQTISVGKPTFSEHSEIVNL